MSRLEIIIPVHSVTRPILRAVNSALSSSSMKISVTVVCHNVSLREIATNLSPVIMDSRLKLLEYEDGIFSPAGPKNYGIQNSSADYLAFLDSDDEFESGALDSWLLEIDSEPDLLFGQFKTQTNRNLSAPLPRVGRFENLEPEKDSLFCRTAPLGLIFKRTLCFVEGFPGFLEGVPNGEDRLITVFLVIHAKTISYSRYRAGYLLWESGSDRVTGLSASITDLLSPVSTLLEQNWVLKMGARSRISLAIALTSISILGPLPRFIADEDFSEADYVAIENVLQAALQFAPGFDKFLSRRHFRLLHALVAKDTRLFRQIILDPASHVKGDSLLTADASKIFSADSYIRNIIRAKYLERKLE